MQHCGGGWNDYLPFRGLTAWFSSSVRPAVSKRWDQYGGSLAGEEDADYLFSDNAFSADTVRVYETQPCVTVFQSAWVNDVISRRCTIHDLALGQYLVLPHYLVQVCVTGDPFRTPEPAALMERHRASQPGAVANRSLSQLLARREESQGQGGSEYEGRRLRNSREFLSQPPNSGPSGGEESACRELCVSEEVGVVARGGKSSDVWHKLMQSMKATSVKDVLHVNCVELLDHELMDFDPHLPEFTMKRGK